MFAFFCFNLLEIKTGFIAFFQNIAHNLSLFFVPLRPNPKGIISRKLHN